MRDREVRRRSLVTLTPGPDGSVGLFTIGLIFARLYHRASKERAFVRTGLGGQKVVKDGGAVVLPIFHEVIPVNMNTLKLEVMRNKAESLITKDRMRVDIVAAFFVRVIPSQDGIANAAQTLANGRFTPMPCASWSRTSSSTPCARRRRP